MDITQLIMIMGAGGGGGSSLPVLESYTTVGNTGGSANTVINKPTGTASGDLLLLLTSLDTTGSSTFTGLDGFSELLFEQGGAATSWDAFGVYTKVAGGSEPSSYTITASGTESTAMILLRISGVDTGSPIDGYTVTNNGNSSTPAAPDYTTTQDNCLVIRLANARLGSGSSYVTATPTTEIARVTGGTGGANNAYTSLGASNEDKVSAGSVGAANFTLASSVQWMAATVAIAPA